MSTETTLEAKSIDIGAMIDKTVEMMKRTFELGNWNYFKVSVFMKDTEAKTCMSMQLTSEDGKEVL